MAAVGNPAKTLWHSRLWSAPSIGPRVALLIAAPTTTATSPSPGTYGDHTHEQQGSQGFHPHRAPDRRRDHRHSGGHRHSEVREHEGEGVPGVDEVRPSQRGNG